MPNYQEHLEASFIITIIDNIINQIKKINSGSNIEFDFKEYLLNIMIEIPIGIITSSIPDQIEPAKNPNHREFFHSFTIIGIIFFLMDLIAKSNINDDIKKMLKSACKQYLGHLLLDLTTPKGLPII